MFGIGVQEMVFLAVIALLVFGPKRLPELARTLGKGMAEFRRASADLRGALSLEPDPHEPPPRPRKPEDEPDPLTDRSPQSTPAQTVGDPDPVPAQASDDPEPTPARAVPNLDPAAAEAALMAELADESNDELHREEPEAQTDAAKADDDDPTRTGRGD